MLIRSDIKKKLTQHMKENIDFISCVSYVIDIPHCLFQDYVLSIKSSRAKLTNTRATT